MIESRTLHGAVTLRRVTEDVPEIRYARSGDVHIAYQTWGTGPHFIGIPPFVQNIEKCWDDPAGRYPHFLRRLGTFCRVTHFDKRGTGLSDRVSSAFSIEERIDDIRAVMDALGVERAFLGGISEGGPMAMLFAATYPERVEKLVLGSTTARFVQGGPDYPFGAPAEFVREMSELMVAHWATPESLLTPVFVPSMVADEHFVRWMTTYERACASPGAVRDIWQWISAIDVRDALASIQCPTLIAHTTADPVVPVEYARYLAEHIPNAKLVEFAGTDHTPWTNDSIDDWVDEMQEFFTGQRGSGGEPDRVLATVLFTDIVGSTETATRLGDARWRQLLDRHDVVTREQLVRFGGHEVNFTGDGFVATFDSPSRAVRAAAAITAAARSIGIEVRAGLHTGEIERRGTHVAGLAVHLGARVAAVAGASEVVVSSTVRDLVLGSEFQFTDRGRHRLKGVDGEWQLLSLAA